MRLLTLVCCVAALTAAVMGTPPRPAVAADITCAATVSREALRTEYSDRSVAAHGGGYNDNAPRLLNRLGKIGDASTQQVCKSAVFAGAIAPGDAAQMTAFLHDNAFVQRVYLNTTGDDAAEGMKIGHAIREAGVGTVAPLAADGDIKNAVLMRDDVTNMRNICAPGASCLCAGACFYIWSGGVVREGNAVRLPDGGALPDTAARESYLNEMGISATWAKDGGVQHKVLPNPLPQDLMYAPATAKTIAAQCGKMPTAEDISPTQKLAPGEAKATYKVQLGRMYQAWQACVELATAR